MKFVFKTLWMIAFASVLTTNADLLIASFDLGDGEAYNGFGPYAGAAAQFTSVNSGNGAVATDNGITAETYNATTFATSISTTDPSNPNALAGDYTVQDGGQGDGQQGNFKLTGLDPDQQYDIYIIAPNGTGYAPDNIYGGDYIVTTGTADANTVTATGGDTVTFTGWVLGQDYAVFSNAMSDETGEFSGTFNRIVGQAHTGIAGIQIVAVPEPASMALIGIFGGGIILARRILRS